MAEAWSEEQVLGADRWTVGQRVAAYSGGLSEEFRVRTVTRVLKTYLELDDGSTWDRRWGRPRGKRPRGKRPRPRARIEPLTPAHEAEARHRSALEVLQSAVVQVDSLSRTRAREAWTLEQILAATTALGPLVAAAREASGG